MVIDLNTGRTEGDTSSLLAKHTFYPDASYFPGGISNRMYKTDKLVMRRIPVSKNVKWVMGQDGVANAAPHYVTLTNSFYMGVYEMTYSQWENLCGGYHKNVVKTFYTNLTDVAVLPACGLDFFCSDIMGLLRLSVDKNFNTASRFCQVPSLSKCS